MTIIGVTGGIGSGKSIICKILALYDIPIYDADYEAKRLNDTSPIIKKKLIDRFGKNIYINNALDKKQLAHIIFNNQEDLKFVNSVIHSELALHFQEWVGRKKDFNTIVIDAAVLFESGFDKYVDKIITVIAPVDIRVSRVSKRDNLTIEQIKSRINSQMKDEERIQASDFVVINDDTQSIIRQVVDILQNVSHPCL